MYDALWRAPIVVPDGEWKMQNLCVRPAELFTNHHGARREAGNDERPVLRCEMELVETRLSLCRGFLLFYYDEFFELWGITPNDHRRVALHARRWVTNYLNGNSHRLDASIGEKVISDHIRF